MRFIKTGERPHGKRHHVDIAGHQNFPLLPAAGHQFVALVQPELFHRTFSLVQSTLPFHQRVLVPLRVVAEQSVFGHQL